MNTKGSSFCKMEYLLDENGQEVLLKEGRYQVMMEWEKPYMEACIEALQPFGDVLEIGFGCGYSASHIQTFKPASHTIIEYHPLVAERARKWAKNHPNTIIIEDTWQNALSKLGLFDCIFFDDYPLQDEREMQTLEKERDQAFLIIEAGKKKMAEIAQQIPFLDTIQYTDEDLEFFFSELDPSQKNPQIQFVSFFFDLAKKNQISQKQLSQILQRLKQKGLVSSEEIEKRIQAELSASAQSTSKIKGDRLFDFLQDCLQNHMKIGARFSCFLSDPTSKFEDEKFFNQVITNPFLEYKEIPISIQVPENCTYYAGDKALVITITKLG